MKRKIKQIPREQFPQLLKEIPDAPKSLYYRGILPSSETKLLAVVGSRSFTQYGRDVCEKLIGELAGYNISIVSGLALGIDSIAHRKALSVGLHTVAIPGSGLDDSVMYPSSHKDLAKQILTKEGTLVSEFEPLTKAAPYMFPKRNRIIAGMSHATLIIEASPKSGTLITARLAMEYNRDVLTVPGSIYSNKSTGPHHLLKNGAGLIESGEDILQALHIEVDSKKESNYELSKEEKIIYNALKEPVTKEELVDSLNIPITEINIFLSALELKGLIKIHLGKIHHL